MREKGGSSRSINVNPGTREYAPRTDETRARRNEKADVEPVAEFAVSALGNRVANCLQTFPKSGLHLLRVETDASLAHIASDICKQFSLGEQGEEV
jgi:hypothetical protein